MPINPLLIKALKAKKCVLILGHDAVLQTDNQTPIYQKVLDEVSALFTDDVFYQQGDEFMYVPPALSDDVYNNIAEIYSHTPAPTFYEQLAQLPFFMFINTSPDLYLKQIFEQKTKQGFQYYGDYYQAQVMPEAVPKTNDEAPLLYNLFGTTDLPISMIFSYDRLFNYMNSLMGQKYKLHPSMTSQIRDAESIVFVGLKFNKIYLNMILWLLDFQGMQRKKFASGIPYPEALEFVKKQFQVSFINENIPEFITDLHKECENLGILRTFKAPTVPLKAANIVTTQGVSKRKEEIIDLLEDTLYSNVFEKLNEIGFEKAQVKNFATEYEGNFHDHTFNDRLKSFINRLPI